MLFHGWKSENSLDAYWGYIPIYACEYKYICTPMHIFAQIIYRICLGNYIG